MMERPYIAGEKDELIMKLSSLGYAIGEDLLQQFMDKYDLQRLMDATVDQLRSYYHFCTKA